MAVEAPYSSYRKTNCILYIILLLVLGSWCAYDGYFSEDWIQEHTNADGSPQFYLKFNRQIPYYAGAAVVAIAVFWFSVRSKKVIADENELIISEKEKIPYSSIQQIDKTHFDSRGFFIISYKDKDGRDKLKALSYKKYDNLKAVLELLVSKIT
jgi:hypothetical protein